MGNSSSPTNRQVISGLPRRGEILAIGMTPEQVAAVPPRLFGVLARAVEPAALPALSPERLEGVLAILSPLVTPEFDAVDVATRLRTAGFRGRYFAFTTTVADARLVQDEVKALAPSLAFELLDIGLPPRAVVVEAPAPALTA